MNSIDSQLEAQIREAGMEVSNEPPQAALDDINNQSSTIMTDKIDTSQTDTPPPPPNLIAIYSSFHPIVEST